MLLNFRVSGYKYTAGTNTLVFLVSTEPLCLARLTKKSRLFWLPSSFLDFFVAYIISRPNDVLKLMTSVIKCALFIHSAKFI